MRILRAWQGALAAALLCGCATAQPTAATVPVGTSTQRITVGGLERTFHLYRPASMDPKRPVPLVLMLHGGYGSGEQAESAYGWDRKADEAGFLVVYPDGLRRAWNSGGGCCGRPGREGVDDVAFLTAVVEAVSREVPVDPKRIFATGMSNGGLMAYRLACDSKLFAAIGPAAGTLMGSCDHPSPTSIIHVHGLADDRVPFAGGHGTGFATVVDGMAVPELIAKWRAVDGCGAPVSTVAGEVTRSITACPEGRAVELITVAGAGHQWPGAKKPGFFGRRLGLAPSQAMNATDEIWAFFAAHPKP